MDFKVIQEALSEMKGATFASLDARVFPVRGSKIAYKDITGALVLLFSSSESGYEAMVRRRLEQEGKDPLSFAVMDLPWGEKINGGPLIYHLSKHYLQCIVLRAGEVSCYINGVLFSEIEFNRIFTGSQKRSEAYHQGLTEDNKVLVRTFDVSGITKLRLMGQTLKTEEHRPILSPRYQGGRK